MSYIPLMARIDSLPPLPESVIKIEELFKDEYPNIDSLVEIITEDPALTTDILAKVNAPLYGFSRTIISIHQAVTLFGSSKIRSIALASSIQKSFTIDLSPYGISTSMFSKISITQSELLFHWYISIDVDIARELSTIAFLMEIGKILIAKEILQEDKKESFLSDLATYENISEVETMYTMMNTAQVNTLVLKHLNFSDSFSEAMKYLDSEKEIPQEMKTRICILKIVQTAINVQEQLSEDSLQKAYALLKENNYNLDVFKRAVKRIKTKYYE